MNFVKFLLCQHFFYILFLNISWTVAPTPIKHFFLILYTLRKVKKHSYFFNQVKNQICLILWSIRFKCTTKSLLREFSFISFRPILASLTASREICSLSLWFSESIETFWTVCILLYFRASFNIFEQMSWKKLCLKHRLDLSQFLDLWSFSKKVLISRDKLFVSKSLPEWFKCRPSFQRHSFFDIRVINKMEIVHETFSFQSFIYYTNKSQVA